MRAAFASLLRQARPVAAVALVLFSGGAAAYFASVAPRRAAGQPPLASGRPAAEAGDRVHRLSRDVLVVPDAVARRIGLKTTVLASRTQPIRLPPLQGTLALDNNRWARVHSRFAGEVVALGTTADPGLADFPTGSAARPLRDGDPVHKGDLLAVVWSRDLGLLKSQMVDAVAALRADELTLRRLEEAYQGGGSERSVRDARQKVAAGRNAVATAERALRTSRLTDEEVAAVRAEADRLATADTPARSTGVGDWARVEVRAPQDGVILEKNVAVGDIVDTAADLFRVGDLSTLVVWTHVYEDDLPLLQSLPRPIRWTVSVPSRPGLSFPGTLDQIKPVIDPAQHTALATGRVENPSGELRVGQFVTVAVDLPPPVGEVELPADAVVEDGRESLAFVRTPDGRYARTPVKVARRFRDVVRVRAEPNGVKPGDTVVTAGALLLRDAMDSQPAPADGHAPPN
ncbi:MAG: efflux RND transporter periplasmic adaptor subunit [Gemmataceae bacterium]